MTATQPELDPQPVHNPRLAVLQHRDFRLLFAGQTISFIGDRLVMVAMPFAVLSLPGATLKDVGIVLGSSAAALALFVLVGGVWGDRLPRQKTMLTSDLVRAAAQTVTAVLLLSHTAHIWQLAILQALYGAAEAFFRPAALGLTPQLVDQAEIQPANALMGLTSNVGMVAGPALAGLLVATVGAGTAIAVDAGTFLVSAAALAAIRPRPMPPADAPPGSFLTELKGGWHEVRSRTWVWSIIVAFSAYHFLVLPALFILGPAVANADRGGAAAWGLISTGFGVGAVTGSLVALRWKPQRPGTATALGLCAGALQSSLVVSPLPTLAVAVAEAFAGIGVVVAFTVWETALQERIPQRAQARVSSFDYLGSLTLMPLGFLVVGPAADAIGNRPAAAFATAVSLAVTITVALGRDVRRLRPLPVR